MRKGLYFDICRNRNTYLDSTKNAILDYHAITGHGRSAVSLSLQAKHNYSSQDSLKAWIPPEISKFHQESIENSEFI